MTTDAFTTAARAEGRVRADEWMEKNGGPQTTGHHIAHASTISGFRQGAEWARDHLAAQEPTAEEVRAAAFAVMELDGDRGLDGFTYSHIARAALTAARAARRDEEKHP